MHGHHVRSLGALPRASGYLTRLACGQAKKAGIDVKPFLQEVDISQRQIEDTEERLKAPAQIRFLNLTADALQDDMLGFHLALQPDLREIGLLYYVSASSNTVREALQRTCFPMTHPSPNSAILSIGSMY